MILFLTLLLACEDKGPDSGKNSDTGNTEEEVIDTSAEE